MEALAPATDTGRPPGLPGSGPDFQGRPFKAFEAQKLQGFPGGAGCAVVDGAATDSAFPSSEGVDLHTSGPSMPSSRPPEARAAGSQPSRYSSHRDTQITAPSGLCEQQQLPARPQGDYLTRLLTKAEPAAPVTGRPGDQDVFRAPEPVQRPAGAPRPSPLPPAAAAAQHKAVAGNVAGPELFARAKARLGEATVTGLRSTMIRQQVTFIEQMYDMHRAIAIQRLLLRNCPQVRQVVDEATKLLSSCGGSNSGEGTPWPTVCGRREAGQAPRAPWHGAGAPPQQSSGMRPDSQFAALPLPGETAAATQGASGDGDGGAGLSLGGSGNGSGGGSTSPQRIVPGFPHSASLHAVAAAAAAAPSGASATPAYQRFKGLGQPHGVMPWGQQQGMVQAPPGYGMVSQDPMQWWYQNYYAPQFQGGGMDMPLAAGIPAMMGTGSTMPMGPSQQVGATGQVGMPGHPPPPPPGAGNRWWQDPMQTFGPAGAPAAFEQRLPDGKRPFEAESAPVLGNRAKRSAGAKRAIYSDGHLVCVVRPAARDWPTADQPDATADEASSGTTGDHRQAHPPGQPARPRHEKAPQALKRKRPVRSRRPPAKLPGIHEQPAADASAAELLLAMSNCAKDG